MKVCPFFVAHAQSPELIQPCEGPFHHPAPSPQSTAMFGVAHREERHDMAGPQTLPDRRRVITSVAGQAIRTMAWASAFSL